MDLRLCHFCNGEEHINVVAHRKRRETVIEMQTVQTNAMPLTQQPRRSESIQLDESSKLPTKMAIRDKIKSENIANSNESLFTIPAKLFTTPTVSASSNFNYIARNGKQTKMEFDQVQPGHYRGTYKGHQFSVVNGKLHSQNGVYNELDKELILENYSQAILAMQQGVLGIEDRLMAFLNGQLPSVDHRKLSELTIPPGSKINVNYTAENGEKSKITFKQIQPGLFRGTCNKTEFTVVNSQILTLDGVDHGLNKDLLLSTFYRALLGVQQTNLGFHRNELVMEAQLSGNQLNPMELLKGACPEQRISFETESLQVHNEFRKLHGVPLLTHSEYLCEMAREWAEHLALKDTSYKRPNNGYGENLFYSHGVPLDARIAITHWYDEINLYNYSDPQISKETGHFTQLVWKDTKEMGTGIATLGDKVWVCCYYHPAGNVSSKISEEFVPRPREEYVGGV